MRSSWRRQVQAGGEPLSPTVPRSPGTPLNWSPPPRWRCRPGGVGGGFVQDSAPWRWRVVEDLGVGPLFVEEIGALPELSTLFPPFRWSWPQELAVGTPLIAGACSGGKFVVRGQEERTMRETESKSRIRSKVAPCMLRIREAAPGSDCRNLLEREGSTHVYRCTPCFFLLASMLPTAAASAQQSASNRACQRHDLP